MRPHLDRSHLLFALMCLAWGATWLAVKVALRVVPPGLLSGSRFVAAGFLLLAWWVARDGSLRIPGRDVPNLLLSTLLMVVVTYPLLFWGTGQVSSGIAAVINLSFLPVALLGFSVAAGEERFDRRRAGAIALGVGGLALLFGPKAMGGAPGSEMELWGGAAIVLSALVYAAGSVLARPILRRHDPVLVSGLTLFGGGLLTTLGALAVEPGALSALPQRWDGTTWTMWLFLVLAGSIAGYTIYLQLVRDWGPSRAGAYCFVSPVIAVGLGMIALGETVGATEIAGMAVMLIAAWSAVRGGREPDPQPS